ncbi:hypothetical protein QBC34DRAFT_487243 [Podospora aff. communis PSN243]|uniref:Uncharacterized protein n=1 Tax=Podospora aff. communis PSN243 TaxID=3040156 RepID=A0AAV9GBN1_9PEZI|nr:hypothetical protein QBC34DRAFT_487243 [Podospora aff. communis PSN243]
MAFLDSTIPVEHNGVKSLIFRCAELLMGLFIFKFATLAAARSRHYTSYLMFTEDHIQRLLFLTSRGISRATVLVFLFTMLSLLASLYGSLLWALDSPGYIFRSSDSTLAKHLNTLNPDAPYHVQLRLSPDTIDALSDKSLSQIVGAGLFKPSINITLTDDVRKGTPETVQPKALEGMGARIWLDDDGFSVSPDTYASVPGEFEINNNTFPKQCVLFDKGMGMWNCTFHNDFAFAYQQNLLGLPEIHWDDQSSRIMNDSQYIAPSRTDNVWSAYGRGSGSAAMLQIFTITKGNRRHTFSESVFRATMLTNPGVPFAPSEITDLILRASGPNTTADQQPLINQISSDMLSAQTNRSSYTFGFALSPDPTSVVQSTFSYLSPLNTVSGTEMFSTVHLSSVNITLLHSETIPDPPAPLSPCDQPFQNEAFGGKITQTNCAGATLSREGGRFYGTVDTAAFLVVYGLGDGRSNISSESLDQNVLDWMWEKGPSVMDLLIARAFAVSVDPGMVTVRMETLVPAVSGLQLLLSVLVAVLAAVAWGALVWGEDRSWSKSFLCMVVHATLGRGVPGEDKGFYMRRVPEVDVVGTGEGQGTVLEGGRSSSVVAFLGKKAGDFLTSWPTA